MNPIDFGGQRSKVKVTIGIYGNKLVNTIATKAFCASWSNLADTMFNYPRATLLWLRSIAAHRDHFVRRLSVCVCVCLSVR